MAHGRRVPEQLLKGHGDSPEGAGGALLPRFFPEENCYNCNFLSTQSAHAQKEPFSFDVLLSL
jgi:hypothetical protein